MSLKVFIAGCLPKDRGQIEGVVKKAMGDCSESGPWNVSLVKIADSWSVNLDGPEPQYKGLSLTSTEDCLHETIVNALGNHGQNVPSRDEPQGDPRSLPTAETVEETKRVGDSPNRYDCPKCGKPFQVIYTPQPQEPEIKASIACPHCWELSPVTVTESAAATEDYRAEAIQA